MSGNNNLEKESVKAIPKELLVIQREIKFRAWDKISRVMHQWDDYAPSSEILNEDYCVLMQFTGLKDKNGKEIYEGDILTWQWNGMDKKYLIIEDIFTTWRKALEFESKGIGRWELPSICEIIGNIFENPELLEVA